MRRSTLAPPNLDLAAVEVDAPNEELVELDDLGLEFRPQAQARATVAESVQRQAHPLTGKGCECGAQGVGIKKVSCLRLSRLCFKQIYT